MGTTLDAFLRSWPFDPWIVVPLVLSACVYVRGWLILRRRGSQRWQPSHLLAFLGGLLAVFLALASPIEPFAGLLLSVHMVQHLLLMMAAPPLLWLGAPLLPLLRGLPQPVRFHWAAPLLRWQALRWCFHQLTRPAPALLLFVGVTWLWHVPRVYEITLRSAGWHHLEHACFLATALLFWYPVIRPFPARVRWSRWLLVPYLLLADVQNTALSALLTFSDQVLYSHYAQVPRLGGFTALDDQALAGVLMWVPGSVAYLLPLAWIGVQLLFGQDSNTSQARSASKGTSAGRIALPLVTPSPCRPVSPSSFDLLRLPLLGRFLRWRHARLALQVPLFLLALLVIGDGLAGPQVSPMNLAGVLPWIHWRGFVVFGLLAAGNVFCLGCPFLLPRTLARRWLPAGRAWPRRLRSKWLAVGLVVLFLWAYEAFALWDSPWLTAWIVLGYFAAAFIVDGVFRGASFCKYVCPIGQFNFVQSLVAPLEIKVRDPVVCQTCATKDCIRGHPLTPDPSPPLRGKGENHSSPFPGREGGWGVRYGGEGSGVRGCELGLFQPRKSSNLDCTFCLDCIHACPHDNVGVLAVTPGAELLRDPQRSGIGRFSRRTDLAALVLVFVCGAFVNAAGMTAPVVECQDRLATGLGLARPTLIVSAGLLAALLMLPLFAIGATTTLGRWWSGDTGRWLETARRFSFALVPLGAAMWLTHYSFHLLTSAGAIIPVSQRLAQDLGTNLLGAPEWGCCCATAASWLLRLEIIFLDVGLLMSLYLGYRIAHNRFPQISQALKAFAPWAVLMVLLFAVGIWIIFQPMEMRGTMEMAR